MTDDERLIFGWVGKALELLLEAEPAMHSEEWRRDVDALRVRYLNRVNAN